MGWRKPLSIIQDLRKRLESSFKGNNPAEPYLRLAKVQAPDPGVTARMIMEKTLQHRA